METTPAQFPFRFVGGDFHGPIVRMPFMIVGGMGLTEKHLDVSANTIAAMFGLPL
jgi:hypothetical protein